MVHLYEVTILCDYFLLGLLDFCIVFLTEKLHQIDYTNLILFKSLSKKLSTGAIINTGCHLKKMSF
jgi:hypothetical protein